MAINSGTDFLLVLGVDKTTSYDNLIKDIDELVSKVNKAPKKIKLAFDIDSSQIKDIQKQITDLNKSLSKSIPVSVNKKDLQNANDLLSKPNKKSANKLSEEYKEATKAVKAYYSEREKYAKKPGGVSLIGDVTDFGNERYEVTKAKTGGDINFDQKLNEQYEEKANKLNKVVEAYSNAKSASDNFSESEKKNFEAQETELKQNYLAKLGDIAASSVKNNDTIISKSTLALKNWSQAAISSNVGSREAYNSLLAMTDAASKAREEYKNSKISLEQYNQTVGDLDSKYKEAETTLKGNNDNKQSFANRVKSLGNKFAAWFGTSSIIMAGYRTIKKMISSVIELDTAMTELKKVTNETDETYERFLSNAATRAKKLGATMADVVTATADFARLGYNIEDAEKLSNAAIIYKNVGDGISDISEASESIISTMKAFGVEANDAMSIVDKFNEVGNNFAISSKGVGDVLLRSAAAMQVAGNSLDETIALAAAANTVVQDPDIVGTSLKTISMYLRAAKTEAENADESTEGMADSVSKLRDKILTLTDGSVDIQLDDNNFKSTYQILKEISSVWEELKNKSDVDAAALTELLGGKRNANVVAALLENFDVAEKALASSSNSANSATRENEKVLESIQGRINEVKASFEDMAQKLIGSDFVKTVIDIGSFILDCINNIIDGVSVITFGTKNLLYVITAIAGVIAAVKLFNNIKAFMTPSGIAQLSVGAALGGIVSLITYLSGAADRAQEAFSNAVSDLSEAMNALEQQRENVDNVLESYTDLALSTEDLSTKKEELLSLQDQLSESFDNEIGKVNLLTNSYMECVRAIQEKQNAEDEQTVENKEASYKSSKMFLERGGYTTTIDGPGWLSFTGHSGEIETFVNKYLSTAQRYISDKYETTDGVHLGIAAVDSWGDFTLSGSAEDVLADLRALQDYMTELGLDYNEFIKPVSDEIKELEEKIKGAKDSIKEYESAKARIEDYKQQTEDIETSVKIDTLVSQIQEQAKAYQEAVSVYDAGSANAAIQSISELREQLYGLAGDSPTLISIVDTLFEGVDKIIGDKTDTIKSKLDEFEAAFNNFNDNELKALSEATNTYGDAIDTITEKKSLNFDDIQDLLELDDSLRDKFVVTADGWSISINDLIDSEKKFQQEKINTIKLNMQAIEVARKEAEVQVSLNKQKISQYQQEISALKASTTPDYNGNREKEISGLRAEIFDLNSANNELTASIEKSQGTYDRWKTALEGVRQTGSAVVKSLKEQVISAYEDMIDAVDDKISELEENRDSVLDTLGDIDSKLAEVDWDNTLDGIAKTTDFSKQLNQALQAVNQDIDGMSKLDRLTDAYDKLSESLDDQITKLEEERDEKIENIRIDGLSADEESKRHKKVSDNLDKEIESYEKLLDTKKKLIEDYDSAISAVTSYIDEQVESINTQVEALEKQKEALQATNDEIDRNLELEKAKNALESARNNKNTLVYRAGSKFRLEANQSDISSAEDNLRTAQLEQQTAAIDKQIEALNNSIEAWNTYKESWTNIADSYEKDQNKIIASQILGSDWTEKISAKDTVILQTTADKYVSTQRVINDSIQKKLDALNAELEAENALNNRRNALFEQEKERLETFYNNKIKTLNEKINGEGGLKEQLWNWYYYQLTLLKSESDGIRSQYDQQIADLQNYRTRLENELNYIEGKENDSWNTRLNNLNNKISEYQGALNRLNELQIETDSVLGNETSNANIIARLAAEQAQAGVRRVAQLIYKVVDKSNGQRTVYDHLSKDAAIMLAKLLNLRTLSNDRYSAISYYGAYASGGVNDYTGLAQMHGSPMHSEVIFNAKDAKKLYDFIHATKNIGTEMVKTLINKNHNILPSQSSAQNVVINVGKVVSDNPVNFIDQMNAYMRKAGLAGLNHR